MSITSYEELELVFQNRENVSDIPVLARLKLPILLAVSEITDEEYVALLQFAMENINSQIPIHGDNVVYEKKTDKNAWEVYENIRRLKDLMPEEGHWTWLKKKYTVTFPRGSVERGLAVVYEAGGGRGGNRRDQWIISERTILILRILRISYLIAE